MRTAGMSRERYFELLRELRASSVPGVIRPFVPVYLRPERPLLEGTVGIEGVRPQHVATGVDLVADAVNPVLEHRHDGRTLIVQDPLDLVVMSLDDYASLDGLSLAALVRDGRVTARELAALAFEAARRVNPVLNAVIELHEDRLSAPESPGAAPFAGIPLLLKDLRLRIACTARPWNDRRVCAPVMSAFERTVRLLQDLGHEVIKEHRGRPSV